METYKLMEYATDQIGTDRLYFVIPAVNDDTIKFEIMWTSGDKLPWRFQLYHTDNWTPCSKLDIMDALEEVEADLDAFRAQLLNKVITQVTYMNMRINTARKLLGDEAIDSGIEAYEEFGRALVAAVNEVVRPEGPKKKLSLVED